jgi:hypothetical protein
MTRQLSPMKKVLYSAVIVLVLVVIVELLASVAGAVVTGQKFSRSRWQRQREALMSSAGRVAFNPNAQWLQDEILHPYVGYTPVPRDARRPAGVAGPVASTPPTRAPDRVTIAFVGGSFAVAFAEHGAPRLMARLSELPAFRGKTLVPLNLAVGGYKQPQQLMSVAYLLSLGAELDLLINLDGFNDVVLHPTENAPARVFPAFPRRWHRRIDGTLQGGALRLMVGRVQLEQQRAALARAFSAAPWRHLNLANLVYVVLDRQLDRRIAETDQQLLGQEQAAGTAAPTNGPEISFASETEMLAHLASLWQRSSRLMDRLARGSGARYYHFLQPNQYVPGSKSMSPAERASAWIANHPYGRLVAAGYPMLQRAGRDLQAEGVRFVDLTGAFAGHAEPLYIDTCCHVGERGNALVADLIFDTIRRDLQRDAAPMPR